MIAATTLIRMIHAISSAFAHHGLFPFQPFHISTPPPSVLRLHTYLILLNTFCQYLFLLFFLTFLLFCTIIYVEGGDALNKRIKLLREKAGLTQADFGARVGAQQTTVSAWEVGRITPNSATIRSICQTFDIREEWLRTGEGPMEIPRPKDEALLKFFTSVLKDQPESIRKRFISSLAAFTPEDWEAAAALMQKLVKGME